MEIPVEFNPFDIDKLTNMNSLLKPLEMPLRAKLRTQGCEFESRRARHDLGTKKPSDCMSGGFFFGLSVPFLFFVSPDA